MKNTHLLSLVALIALVSVGHAKVDVKKLVANARVDLDNAPAGIATAISQQPKEADEILTGAVVEIPERAVAILAAALEVMPGHAKEFVRISIIAQPELSQEFVSTAIALFPDQASEIIATAIEVAPEDMKSAIAAPGRGNGATFDPSGRIPGTYRGKPPSPPFPAQPIKPGIVSPSR
ncbi:MAG TPA: hypothetical protein VMM36_03050 [Opitutaceae bacterium]|nr:hypothetical protein [Opitutaceae bacterium]